MKPHPEHYRFLKLLREHKQKEIFSFLGLELFSFPNVFSPIVSKDTEWFAKQLLKFVSNKDFLEVGAGTGAISILMKSYKAKNVVATDISSSSIKNIKANVLKTKTNLQIIKSDVFKKVGQQKFDIIFWNHPFYMSKNKPKDELEVSISDYKYLGLEQYFINFNNHLNKNGKCLLGTGHMSGYFNEIEKLATKNSCILKLVKQFKTAAHKKTKKDVELAIYEVIKISK